MQRLARREPTPVRVRAFAGEDPVEFAATPTASAVDWLGVDLGALTVVESDTPGVWLVGVPMVLSAQVRRLTVTVEGTIEGGLFDGQAWEHVETVDVVGARYADLGEIRGGPGMSSGRWTIEQLLTGLGAVESRLEEFLGTSLVLAPFEARGKACELATVDDAVRLPERFVRSVVSMVDDDGVVDLTDAVVAPEGVIRGVSVSGDVTALGVRGFSEVPSSDIREAVVQWVADVVSRQSDSVTSRRQTSLTNEFGNVSMATAGADRPSGIPDVDATLLAWRDRLRLPGLA